MIENAKNNLSAVENFLLDGGYTSENLQQKLAKSLGLLLKL